jgi:hypothetical protein
MRKLSTNSISHNHKAIPILLFASIFLMAGCGGGKSKNVEATTENSTYRLQSYANGTAVYASSLGETITKPYTESSTDIVGRYRHPNAGDIELGRIRTVTMFEPPKELQCNINQNCFTYSTTPIVLSKKSEFLPIPIGTKYAIYRGMNLDGSPCTAEATHCGIQLVEERVVDSTQKITITNEDLGGSKWFRVDVSYSSPVPVSEIVFTSSIQTFSLPSDNPSSEFAVGSDKYITRRTSSDGFITWKLLDRIEWTVQKGHPEISSPFIEVDSLPRVFPSLGN